jgi:hypothetical protein
VKSGSPLEYDLKSALLGTGMVQPVSSGFEKGKNGRLWVLCRQLPHRERPWLKVVHLLLSVAEDMDVELHICRRYVLKEGRLVFGWYVGVSGPPRRVQRTVEGLLATLAGVEAPLDAVDEDGPSGRAIAAPGDEDGPVEPERRFQLPVAPGRRAGPPVAVVRPPGAPAAVEDPPEDFTPRIRVVRNTTDSETGRRIIEEEMPLPHVYREMNKPAHEFGRGAKFTGSTGPARRR